MLPIHGADDAVSPCAAAHRLALGSAVDKHRDTRERTMQQDVGLAQPLSFGAALLGFFLSVTALTATMVMLGSLAA